MQDHSGAQVSPDLLKTIAAENERVSYCKVETAPTPTRIGDAVSATNGKVGIFGGAGGNYFIEELKRGSTGIMPGCSQPAAYVRIWDLLHAGDIAGATSVFYKEVLPLNRAASAGMNAFYYVNKYVNKQLLQRRGVIRPPVEPPDAITESEVDEVISRLLEIEARG